MTRTFGIEIEAYGNSTANVAAKLNAAGISCRVDGYYNHEARSYWKIVSDGSLRNDRGNNRNCYEIVSPILQGEEGLRQVRVVMQVLQRIGAKVNRSCGMHVHVGAAGLDVRAFKRIAKAFLVYEPFFDSVVSPERQRSNAHYTRSNVQALSHQGEAYSTTFQRGGFDEKSIRIALTKLDECDTVSQVIATMSPNRSMKLNMTAINRHGTLEFRQHHGAICPVAASEWIKLILAFVERSKDLKEVEGYGATPKPGQLAKSFYSRHKLSPETIAHFEARRARFEQVVTAA